jgi:hypothetical protein
MRYEKIISTFVIMGMFLTGVSKATGENQAQQEQIKQIENYISQQRQKTEDYYENKLAELELNRDAEIGLLEVVDKGIFSTLAAQAKIAEKVLGIKETHKPKGSIEDTIDKSPKRFAEVQSRIAEAKNDVLAGYDREAAKLEKQKRYALTVRLPELEEHLKENLSAEKPQLTVGLISSIVYSERKPSAIIGDRITHQQETMQGVKIVRIYRDRVEFEKNGKKWEQKVREPAKAYWQ